MEVVIQTVRLRRLEERICVTSAHTTVVSVYDQCRQYSNMVERMATTSYDAEQAGLSRDASKA